MARPERNDVDYFPHPVNHGRKMFYLDNKYGNDGYSVWNRTMEVLGNTNYHFIDLSDETQLMYLSTRCIVSEEKYIEIIDVLVKFGEFDKELWQEHHILWNQKFIESIKPAYDKRVNDCITRGGLLEKLGFPVPETRKQVINPVPETLKSDDNIKEIDDKGADNPQSKVEYSKVKKSKEEKKGTAPCGTDLSKDFYSKEFQKAKGHQLTRKYFHIVEYIYNLTPNIINDPGTHILKLEKQLSFEDYCKLYTDTAKRGIAIKDLIDSWLNNPSYSKGKISVYATLLRWAQKEPIKGTNHSSKDSKTPIVKTSIGQVR